MHAGCCSEITHFRNHKWFAQFNCIYVPMICIFICIISRYKLTENNDRWQKRWTANRKVSLSNFIIFKQWTSEILSIYRTKNLITKWNFCIKRSILFTFYFCYLLFFVGLAGLIALLNIVGFVINIRTLSDYLYIISLY